MSGDPPPNPLVPSGGSARHYFSYYSVYVVLRPFVPQGLRPNITLRGLLTGRRGLVGSFLAHIFFFNIVLYVLGARSSLLGGCLRLARSSPSSEGCPPEGPHRPGGPTGSYLASLFSYFLFYYVLLENSFLVLSSEVTPLVIPPKPRRLKFRLKTRG